MTGYTVIDVETTGLSPTHHDRIVEIGIVYVSHQGEIQDHWSSLVNPGRDVGPTRIHGITATDIAQAPTFKELAPYVLHALSGRIPVAHNASFDTRFLAHELRLAGVTLPDIPIAAVCTMEWSPAFLDAPSRRLTDVCRAAGVTQEAPHCAGGDALATAAVLARFLDAAHGEPPWQETLRSARAFHWPSFAGAYPELRMLHRAQARASRHDSWLDRVVSRMPRAACARVDQYLAVLEMALLDRFLAEHEKRQLVAVAKESGLTRGQVLDLHLDYLRAMAEVALDDHVVTDEERHDLERVATLLGLPLTDVDDALAAAAEAHLSGEARAGVRMSASTIPLHHGDRVVFTGDMRRDRGEWESVVTFLGLRTGGVTRDTRVLVAADPNSLSGKAARARAYGIPVITEAAFEQLVAAQAGRLRN